jgi:hypothetical protein
MQLSLIYSKPSAILRALTEARLLMANHARELTEAMDELIVVASEYIDAQGKVQELGNQEDEDQVRESAVEAARMVAKILVSHGGDAARAALGVPPPDPLEQQRLRSTLLFDAEGIASGLNSVILEIDDDADHGTAGRHYRVSASLYLPVNLDDEELQRSGPWGARWIAA